MTHEEFIDQYMDAQNKWYIKNDTLYIRYAVDFIELYIKNITELPDNLHIEQWLDIQETQITKLPENLHIGGMLYSNRSLITELPDSITFGIRYNIDLMSSFNDGVFLIMCEKVQLTLILQNKYNFTHIQNPTEKAKTMQKLLWKL